MRPKLTPEQRKSLALWREHARRMNRATWLDRPDMAPVGARLAVCRLALELMAACSMVEIVAGQEWDNQA